MSKIFDSSFIQSFHEDRFISTKFADQVFQEIDFIFQMAELKKQRPSKSNAHWRFRGREDISSQRVLQKKTIREETAQERNIEDQIHHDRNACCGNRKKLLQELLKAIGGPSTTSDPETSFDAVAKKIGLKAIFPPKHL